MWACLGVAASGLRERILEPGGGSLLVRVPQLPLWSRRHPTRDFGFEGSDGPSVLYSSRYQYTPTMMVELCQKRLSVSFGHGASVDEVDRLVG